MRGIDIAQVRYELVPYGWDQHREKARDEKFEVTAGLKKNWWADDYLNCLDGWWFTRIRRENKIGIQRWTKSFLKVTKLERIVLWIVFELLKNSMYFVECSSTSWCGCLAWTFLAVWLITMNGEVVGSKIYKLVLTQNPNNSDPRYEHTQDLVIQ